LRNCLRLYVQLGRCYIGILPCSETLEFSGFLGEYFADGGQYISQEYFWFDRLTRH